MNKFEYYVPNWTKVTFIDNSKINWQWEFSQFIWQISEDVLQTLSPWKINDIIRKKHSPTLEWLDSVEIPYYWKTIIVNVKDIHFVN